MYINPLFTLSFPSLSIRWAVGSSVFCLISSRDEEGQQRYQPVPTEEYKNMSYVRSFDIPLTVSRHMSYMTCHVLITIVDVIFVSTIINLILHPYIPGYNTYFMLAIILGKLLVPLIENT